MEQHALPPHLRDAVRWRGLDDFRSGPRNRYFRGNDPPALRSLHPTVRAFPSSSALIEVAVHHAAPLPHFGPLRYPFCVFITGLGSDERVANLWRNEARDSAFAEGVMQRHWLNPAEAGCSFSPPISSFFLTQCSGSAGPHFEKLMKLFKRSADGCRLSDRFQRCEPVILFRGNPACARSIYPNEPLTRSNRLLLRHLVPYPGSRASPWRRSSAEVRFAPADPHA